MVSRVTEDYSGVINVFSDVLEVFSGVCAAKDMLHVLNGFANWYKIYAFGEDTEAVRRSWEGSFGRSRFGAADWAPDIWMPFRVMRKKIMKQAIP